MSDIDIFDNMAHNDFDNAVSKAFWHKWMSKLMRKSNRLLSFNDVLKRRKMRGQRSLGVMTVAVENIVGSVGRTSDFDDDFMPLNGHTQERWTRVDRAFLAGRDLPPVELYKVRDSYFVVDGNHRVSVAHVQGQDFIDAQVTEIDLRTLTSEIPVVRLDNN
jgi:hypothetical protein